MKSMPLANSLAAAMAVCWVVMALFIWMVPGLSLVIFRGWLLGASGFTVTGFSLDTPTFLVGGITAVVSAWLFGYVWGWFYKKFS